MNDTIQEPAPNPSTPPAELKADNQLDVAAYNQNFETFRALNALMWQIPLIAMTLTGGLWFGVSTMTGMPGLRKAMLLLAAAGDIGLIFVLHRLRFIMGEYLTWLKGAYGRGHVAADGDTLLTKGKTVRTIFQLMLGFASIISLVLFIATILQSRNEMTTANPTTASIAWYDMRATELADNYEAIAAEKAHPKLFKLLKEGPKLKILDVGAGTGRDAAAYAELGHRVRAVEPSSKMRQIGRRLHPHVLIQWSSDSLPSLKNETGAYDLITLSAVWMHVPPAERAATFDRLTQLLTPDGRLYLTLRLGPAEPDRSIWSVTEAEIRDLAETQHFEIEDFGSSSDLLGRGGIRWQSLLLTRQASD